MRKKHPLYKHKEILYTFELKKFDSINRFLRFLYVSVYIILAQKKKRRKNQIKKMRNIKQDRKKEKCNESITNRMKFVKKRVICIHKKETEVLRKCYFVLFEC